jgi:type II secretory pathway component GspD/PulD (secretin)
LELSARNVALVALGAVIMISTVDICVAQETPIVSSDSTRPPVAVQMKLPISLKAQNANLSDILKALSNHSGMNFVTGDISAKEKVSIVLNNTPLDEAIDLIVRAAGLAYEVIGNSVLVADPDKLNKGEISQQGYVVTLNHANARDVAVMLEKITPNIKVDEAGNRLICFTSPRILDEIERMVKAIDQPQVMVVLETRLVETELTVNNQYGIDWSQLTPLVSGLSHNNYALNNGWTLLSPTSGSSSTGAAGTASGNSNSAIGIDLALDMMIQDGNAHLLIDSKLATTNNHPAEVYVGDDIPYEVQAYNTGAAAGGAAQTQVQISETGIKISLEPHVNENNQVTIKVDPEVSNIVEFLGVNKDLPHTQVRRTSTTVRVEDGHTVFIAGLLRDDDEVTVTKFPILGEIPLLGYLFQNRKHTRLKTNLILEITPRILKDSTGVLKDSAGAGT